ncbi:Endonuclease domain-containing 1 protein [Bagarius yarrelli]|uniref:Endonuclease domain-containing 1 protein n=1 Tax=Bagarius yarrelli TaxID=175774 RepID=A0A556V884_BAGYA|nr:Endonuclease domain-containing 1 protein [Bagarius yarrelli]
MIYLLILLPAFSLSEVTSFTRCPQFFFREFFPTILKDFRIAKRYEQICQCSLDANDRPQYFYATLYDTINKIPVYSAYLDKGNVMCMTTQRHIPPSTQGKRQALNSDYGNSSYEKGHLFPVLHTHNRETMLATFTLTNAAPQYFKFNRGIWKAHEGNLVPKLKKCKTAYVVTGVIPGQESIGKGVKVAKFLWNAYCCITADNSTSSEGFLGPNYKNEVTTYTKLRELENVLENYYDPEFSIFQNLC